MSSRPTSVGDNNQRVIEIVPQIKVLNFQQVLEVFETSLLCDFDFFCVHAFSLLGWLLTLNLCNAILAFGERRKICAQK